MNIHAPRWSVLVSIFFALGTSTTAVSAHASTLTFDAGNFEMAPNDSKRLDDVQFVYDENGDLLAFHDVGPLAWFSTSTKYFCTLKSKCRAKFTTDGNLVLNDGASDYWQSGTGGHPGARMVFSSQQPYILIKDAKGNMLWNSDQPGKTAPTQLRFTGQSIILSAPNVPLDFGNRSLILKTTGELQVVLRGHNNSTVWVAKPFSPCAVPSCLANWQVTFNDGELRVTHEGIIKFATGTDGNPGAQLILNGTEPHISIQSSTGRILWTSGALVQPAAELKFPADCVSSPRIFDVKYFRKMNPQVTLGDSDQAYADFWCSKGLKQGMRGSPYFAPYDYFRMYPALKAKFSFPDGKPDYVSAAKYFLEKGSNGIGIGFAGSFLNPNTFDLEFYRSINHLGADLSEYDVIIDYLHRGISLGLPSHPYFWVTY